MSIVYEGYGNILTHKAQTIACPVNVVGVMGKGLAASMRNRIRGLEKFYKDLCETGQLDIGVCHTYPIPNSEQQVLLFPTKDHYRNPSKVEYVESGLKYVVENLEELKIDELAVIPFGCGLGRLDYNKEVRPLVYKYLDDLDIKVYALLRDLD